jgi:hypothetical protein
MKIFVFLDFCFADNILTNIHNISGANGVNQVMKHNYDHRGRKTYNIININGTGDKTLANMVYNHRDELIERNIGRYATTGTMQYLQSIDYTSLLQCVQYVFY